MVRIKRTIAATALVLAASASSSFADAADVPLIPNIGADASVGTNGANVNVQLQMNPFITLRGGYNYFEFELTDVEWDDIKYDVELDFTQPAGFVDLHPFMNGFTVTAGYYLGDRTIDFTSTPTENVEIGGQIFTPEQVGELSGSGSFGDDGVYAGIGWDTTTRGVMPVSFVVRLGVILTDPPEVELLSQGGLGDSDPNLRAFLDEQLLIEAELIEDDIENLRYYPVLSFGFGFGF
ncbi:MAG: hypothetical protein AAFX52_15830 [Pseudomonadota bacterium]